MHECSAMHASRFDAVAWNVLKFEFRNLPCPILKVKSLCSQKSIHQIQNLAGLNFNSSNSNAMTAQCSWKSHIRYLIKSSC